MRCYRLFVVNAVVFVVCCFIFVIYLKIKAQILLEYRYLNRKILYSEDDYFKV